MTRDFFWDAADILCDSNTPHILVGGFEGIPKIYSSSNLGTQEEVDWFREEVNALLDEISEEIQLEDGGGAEE